MRLRSITDAYGMGNHSIYTHPYIIHMYCKSKSMNRVLQGRRQLLLEVRRLGSYRGYDKVHRYIKIWLFMQPGNLVCILGNFLY